MFLVEFTTQSGSLYTVNVVNRKIRVTKSTGEEVAWRDYQELKEGHVGSQLQVDLGAEGVITTTPVVELKFPEVGA